MTLLSERITQVPPPDIAATNAARERQDRLTKPRGALGRLEELSIRLAGMTGEIAPDLSRKAVVVMAADHGVVAQGVSAYPQEVTAQMVLNFLRGGAAINVLAKQMGARVAVVDIGVAAGLGELPGLMSRKVAPGTRDLSQEPAMTRQQAIQAIETGIEIVDGLAADGLDLLATGEMGIGNTTPSSALVACFTGEPPERVTGYGTGVSDEARRQKVKVVEDALALHHPDPADPLAVLTCIGGLEIAGLAGAVIAAAARRVPVVIDGFISTAAALVAVGLCPAAREYLIASHRSQEPGHRAALAHLGLEPLFDLNLRLGEGTGAVLAFPMIEAASRLLGEMATFGEAGVSGPD